MEQNTANPHAVLRYLGLTALAAAVALVSSRVVAVNQTTAGMVFLVMVLVTAYRWRFAYSIYLSVLCTLLYNFFFLPPVGKLTVADPQNWIALTAFLCTSVLVSQLSNRERREKEAADARRREIELLYRLSQKLLVQDDLKELARSTPSIVASVFDLRAVALYAVSADIVSYSDPNRILVSSEALKSLEWSGDEAIVEKDGVKLIALRLGMRHDLGRLAIAGDNLGAEMCEAVASLISVALERAAALERSNRLEAARASERLRAALLDSVAHDLRTPLTSIRAAATALVSQSDLPPPERLELVSVIDEESARLDRLIGQAVEMAQFDAAAVTLHRQEQDVQELVDTVLEEMQNLLRGHPVAMHVEEGMPPVAMDRELIGRALRHLVENAARYSPPGTAISLNGRRDGSRLLIEVTDRGPGIDAAEQPFLFDKFFRGRQSRSSQQGTGMGLAIAKAITEAHGGGITVSSTPGRGACFTLWLPVRYSDAQRGNRLSERSYRSTA